MIPGYDQWKTQPYAEEEKVAFDCDHCDGEVYVGEDYICTVDGDVLHPDCFDEYARSLLITFYGPAEELDR